MRGNCQTCKYTTQRTFISVVWYRYHSVNYLKL